MEVDSALKLQQLHQVCSQAYLNSEEGEELIQLVCQSLGEEEVVGFPTYFPEEGP